MSECFISNCSLVEIMVEVSNNSDSAVIDLGGVTELLLLHVICKLLAGANRINFCYLLPVDSPSCIGLGVCKKDVYQ